jgi:glycosyltransferase involved in cell wall biosynthesis
MRVLYVNPASELGGSERSLLDLLAALGECAPELEKSLVLFAEGELAGRARELGVAVRICRLPAPLAGVGESTAGPNAPRQALGLARAGLGLPRFLASLRRTLRAERPDIVHTNGMKAHLLALAAVPELPRVVHLRDFASERPLSRRALPLLGFRSTIVTNSRAVAADALALAPSLRARVIYNGIDLDDFSPRPGDARRLASLAGLEPPPSDAINVGLVATYAWWKGHRRFIAAAREIVNAEPALPLRFYIVGGPIYRASASQLTVEELRRLVSEQGLERCVGLVPFQVDAAAVYRDLDIVVHASERPEPFGRTIVEAMASGRAVVVARAGGAVELFDEGRTALGYDPGSTGALAGTVLQLARDSALRQRLGSAAREAAMARFDRRRLGPELLAVYRELLATSG